MLKAFQYRIVTAPAIEQKLDATLELCRELYNAALTERRQAYQLAAISINYCDQANQLPDIKQSRTDLKSVQAQVLQQVLKRLDNTFQRFFERVKKGERVGYPRYKSKFRFHSFTYPQSGWKLTGNKLWLSKIGTMRLRISRPIAGHIKTVTIKRDGEAWYAIFVCEIPPQPLPETSKVKAIDVGLEYFLTDQDGRQVDNPQFFRRFEERVSFLQRMLARTKKGSGHWYRIKKRLANLYKKIRNKRKDYLHKLSRKLVNNNDVIFYEDLNIKGMVQNHHLSKSISDTAWAMFLTMLSYKVVETGKIARNVAARDTSQNCSGCGNKVPKALSQRWHRCSYCGLVLHRDKNSAKNILARGIKILLAEGLAVMAPGGLTLVGSQKGEPLHLASSLVTGALL